MGLRKLLSLILLLLLFGCSLPARKGPMFQASSGVLLLPDTVVPREEIVRKSRDADFILIGEGHTNSCDHRMQAALVEQMASAGIPLVLGFEMLRANMQEELDRFNKGSFPLEKFPRKVQWEENWGYPFSLYQPIFEVAAKYSIPVHGLNLPSAIVRKVGKEGRKGLNEDERKFLPDEIILPLEEQQKSLSFQYNMHKEFLNREETEQGFERFLLAQSLWDTYMAEQAISLSRRTGKKVVILAGAGHVKYEWGIAYRIRQLEPASSILTVLPWRGKEDPDDRAADLFFFCPQTHQSKRGFELQSTKEGVVVSRVEKDSLAQKSGLVSGDIILTASGREVSSFSDLHRAAFLAHKEGAPLQLSVDRNGQVIELELYDASKEEE